MSNTAPRTSAQERKSAETDIRLELNLDGQGITDVKTGFGLLDHMLTLTAFWGGMDLRLVCEGDMEVDAHHTTEHVGLLFGKALLEALGKGDEVVTQSGMVGRITKVSDDFVTVEIAANVEVQMQKPSIVVVLPKGTLKSL